MTATNELLDKAREAANISSDSALSQRLGITRAVISAWRKQLYPMPDERIAQVCALAKLDGPEWMARIHADRAQSPAERALWSKMLVRLAAAAIFVAPLSAGAADKSPQNQAFTPEKSPGMYIMLKTNQLIGYAVSNFIPSRRICLDDPVHLLLAGPRSATAILDSWLASRLGLSRAVATPLGAKFSLDLARLDQASTQISPVHSSAVRWPPGMALLAAAASMDVTAFPINPTDYTVLM